MAGTLTAAELEGFFELLRSTSKPPAVHQLIAAHDLLLILSQRGEWPREATAFATILAPVFCSTAAEQEQFYAAFRKWLSALRNPPQPIHMPAITTALLRREVRVKVSFAATLALVGLIVVGDLVRHRKDEVEPPPSAPEKTLVLDSVEGTVQSGSGGATKPVADAVAYFPPGKQAKSGPDGKFSLRGFKPVPQLPLLMTHVLYEPVLLQIDPSNAGLLRVQMQPRQGIVVPRDVTTPPASPFRLWWERHLRLLRWLSLFPVAPLILYWCWLLFRYAQLRKWRDPLERSTLRQGTGDADVVFDGRKVSELARDLRRRKPVASNEISTDRTIRATIDRGGLFSPVQREQKVAKEYLILMERVNHRDHQAAFQTQLVQHLESEGVYIDSYYFGGDPRECQPASTHTASAPASCTVQDLASWHPQHTLLLFSESDKLFDRRTGEPAGWLSSLSRWSERAALTPVSSISRRHAQLASLEFQVAAPSRAGLAEILSQFESAAVRGKLEDQEYPELLAGEPGPWLVEHAPERRIILRLITQLRRYLGPDGFRLLGACAVYPAILWPLTADFAKTLIPRKNREAALQKVVRLPWFRHGRLPDWLRSEVTSVLEQDEVDLIRDALDSFHNRSDRATEPEWLDYAGGRVRPPKPRNPLRDPIFLCVVWGLQLDRLGVRPRSRILQKLFRYGRPVFGLHPVVQSLLALTLSGGWLLATNWIDRVTTPPKPKPVVALANGYVGAKYNAPLDHLYTVPTGQLPPGLALAKGGMQITGTPTRNGVYWFTLRGASKRAVAESMFRIIIENPTHPLLARAVEIAASRLGAEARSGRELVADSLLLAAEIIDAVRPFERNRFVAAAWAGSRAVNQIPVAVIRSEHAEIKPGYVFVNGQSGSEQVGIVEQVYENDLATIEVINRIVTRSRRGMSEIDRGFLNFGNDLVNDAAGSGGTVRAADQAGKGAVRTGEPAQTGGRKRVHENTPVSTSKEPAEAPNSRGQPTPASESDRAQNLVDDALKLFGTPSQALDKLVEAMKMKPDWYLPYFWRGRLVQQLGNCKQAIEDFNQALARNPQHSTSLYARGTCYDSMGDLDAALRDYHTTIDMEGRAVYPHTAIGGVYIRKGDNAEALKWLDTALSIDPTFVWAYQLRAQARAALGDQDGAAADRQRAAELQKR